jgi:hypothetical protein
VFLDRGKCLSWPKCKTVQGRVLGFQKREKKFIKGKRSIINHKYVHQFMVKKVSKKNIKASKKINYKNETSALKLFKNSSNYF